MSNTMTPEDINALSGEELRTQAKVLEISLKGNPGDALIRERMMEALGLAENSKLDSDNSNQTSSQNTVQSSTVKKADKKPSKMVTIVIATKEDDDQPVAVGLNGKVFRMMRGEEVTVPVGVVDILNNAKQLVRDRKSGKDREVLAYSFQTVG